MISEWRFNNIFFELTADEAGNFLCRVTPGFFLSILLQGLHTGIHHPMLP
jgi:hypothetical protein